jgi:hypothetical protein
MGALWLRITALTLSVAAILLAIAALVRTTPSVHLEWGTVTQAFAAIGTVGALAWGVGQGLYLIAQGNREKLVDHARQLSGWTVPLPEQHSARERFPVAQYGRLPYGQAVHLTNSSAEAAYEVVVYLVWTQGAAAHTGEEIETHYGSATINEPVTRMRANRPGATAQHPLVTPCGSNQLAAAGSARFGSCVHRWGRTTLGQTRSDRQTRTACPPPG